MGRLASHDGPRRSQLNKQMPAVHGTEFVAVAPIVQFWPCKPQKWEKCDMTSFELFDRNLDWEIGFRFRPHWVQAGAIVFVTMRQDDSIPVDVMRQWDIERTEWLRRLGIDPNASNLMELIKSLPQVKQEWYRRFWTVRVEKYLDCLHGSCRLRDRENASLVAQALRYFDGDRYELGDFVVMPNHVHLLAAFRTEEDMKDSLSSWMRFTARTINARAGKRGAFWFPEPFDHMPRSIEKYEQLREYIRDNPVRARLKDDEFVYYRRA